MAEERGDAVRDGHPPAKNPPKPGAAHGGRSRGGKPARPRPLRSQHNPIPPSVRMASSSSSRAPRSALRVPPRVSGGAPPSPQTAAGASGPGGPQGRRAGPWCGWGPCVLPKAPEGRGVGSVCSPATPPSLLTAPAEVSEPPRAPGQHSAAASEGEARHGPPGRRSPPRPARLRGRGRSRRCPVLPLPGLYLPARPLGQRPGPRGSSGRGDGAAAGWRADPAGCAALPGDSILAARAGGAGAGAGGSQSPRGAAGPCPFRYRRAGCSGVPAACKQPLLSNTARLAAAGGTSGGHPVHPAVQADLKPRCRVEAERDSGMVKP